MTIRECYTTIGGDYEEAISRLMNDRLVTTFAVKFLKDPSFGELTACLDSDRTEDAFRAAHTLKGVCKNLAFTKLAETASELTEMLRDGDLRGAKIYYPVLEAEYTLATDTIKKVQ